MKSESIQEFEDLAELERQMRFAQALGVWLALLGALILAALLIAALAGR